MLNFQGVINPAISEGGTWPGGGWLTSHDYITTWVSPPQLVSGWTACFPGFRLGCCDFSSSKDIKLEEKMGNKLIGSFNI